MTLKTNNDWDEEKLLIENVVGIAHWLHENYEEIASKKGWTTQEKTRVPFDELPQANKEVMWELSERLQAKIEKIVKTALISHTKATEEKVRGEIIKMGREYHKCGACESKSTNWSHTLMCQFLQALNKPVEFCSNCGKVLKDEHICQGRESQDNQWK